MRKQLAISLLLVGLMVLATAGVILYGMGYRFSLNKGTPAVSGTGLLVATSAPDGAQVFINEHLTTATDNTINLEPGAILESADDSFAHLAELYAKVCQIYWPVHH